MHDGDTGAQPHSYAGPKGHRRDPCITTEHPGAGGHGNADFVSRTNDDGKHRRAKGDADQYSAPPTNSDLRADANSVAPKSAGSPGNSERAGDTFRAVPNRNGLHRRPRKAGPDPGRPRHGTQRGTGRTHPVPGR